MSFFGFLRRPVAHSDGYVERNRDRIDLHIERFSQALEQGSMPGCEAELQRNLDYWRAIKAAGDLL